MLELLLVRDFLRYSQLSAKSLIATIPLHYQVAAVKLQVDSANAEEFSWLL